LYDETAEVCGCGFLPSTLFDARRIGFVAWAGPIAARERIAAAGE